MGATHGLFSSITGDSSSRRLAIDQVVVTNTLLIPEEGMFAKLKVLSIAPSTASGLRAVFEDSSVSASSAATTRSSAQSRQYVVTSAIGGATATMSRTTR